MSLKQPSTATLKKYGLTLGEWEFTASQQKWVCAICSKLDKTGVLCIDHHHVKGWKKMKPEDRKKYIRGLACRYCNKFILGRHKTSEKLKVAATYLDVYNAKLEQC